MSDDALTNEQHEEFLGALTALGGSAGNGRLRAVLEWEEAGYERVRAELLQRGLIVLGRGRGGSVALAGGEASRPPLGAEGEGERLPRAPRTARASAGASSFDQAFRAIDDCLRKEAGCGTELDYTEQTSWLLFLKYLDGLEDDRAAMALLEGRARTPILEEPYRWNSWAAPKTASGQLDQQTALTSDDLRDFVNQQLFRIWSASSSAPVDRTRSSTRSARSSASCATRSAVATTCAKSST